METLEKQVQRWKLLAMVGLAFGAGMLAQQYGTADAQAGKAKVQLDTSNCTYGVVTGSSPYNMPKGSLLMQAIKQGSGTYDTAWVYNTCK